MVCQDARVVAFYCLANGALLQAGAPGRALLRDALLRTLQAAEIAGVRAILVHAKDDRARAFYERGGFLPSPIDPLTLMLPLKDARAALDFP